MRLYSVAFSCNKKNTNYTKLVNFVFKLQDINLGAQSKSVLF